MKIPICMHCSTVSIGNNDREMKKSVWCNMCLSLCFSVFSLTLVMLSFCYALGFQGQEKPPRLPYSVRLIFQWWLYSADGGTLLPLHWTWVWLCVNMCLDGFKCVHVYLGSVNKIYAVDVQSTLLVKWINVCKPRPILAAYFYTECVLQSFRDNKQI